MKAIKTTVWTVLEANQRLKTDYSSAYWAFLIRMLNYQEVKFDATEGKISFFDYIPLTELLNEVGKQIKDSTITPQICRVCSEYFDINKEDGIFGDPANLERFICKTCAKKLSALDFYMHHLVQ